MKISDRSEKKYLYLGLSFAVPCASMLVLMLIAGYTPFGDRSMLYSDMWHQYYPFFKAFRDALRSGDSLLYTWNIGMGLDYLGLISYYLASPLNILSVLLPEGWVLGYFGLLVPIKLGFAGLFFSIFLKHIFDRNDISIVPFSCFYALCAWALGYQWNVMWLDSFALLPLVALGAVSLLKDRKFLLYTISLFLAIFCNYYVGFFVCIFVVLIFICYEICCCKSVVQFLKDLAWIAVFSILAAGMTAILTLPAYASLQNTQSSVNSFPEGFSMNIVSSTEKYKAAREAWTAYKNAKETESSGLFGLWFTAMKQSFGSIFEGMGMVAGNMSGGLEHSYKEGLPNIYTGVGTITLAFLFLTASNVKLREKMCCLFLLVFFMLSFLLRQLDYIWHGFHFTNMIPYRFSFLFSFVMLYMAYRAFLMRPEFKLWQIIPAGMLTICIFLCSDKFEEKDTVFMVYNGVFFLLYMATLVMGQIKFRKPVKKDKASMRRYNEEYQARVHYLGYVLLGVMALEIVINVVNFGVRFPYTGISNYPKGTTNTHSMIQYMKEDDDLFYRAEVTHTQTLNDAALNGYNGISTFTSSANVNATLFMQNLGFAGKNTYNRYSFEEGSPVANLFLNLKYMLERDGAVEDNPYFSIVHSYGNVYLLENNAYLPLGFLAESQLADLTFEKVGSTFTFQNLLFSAATGMTEEVWDEYGGKVLTIEPNGTVMTNEGNQGYCAYNNESAQTTLVYRYDIIKSGFFCADLTMSARNSYQVWLNGTQLYSESISLPQTVAVSQVNPGDIVEIKITCKANEKGSVTINSALLNDDVFRAGYEVLAASTLELTHFSNTRVEGTINCNRDGLMYTSIPQNGENWHVAVDGKEVKATLIGDCMMAVELTEGEHEIVFTYKNSACHLGACITILSVLILALAFLFFYRDFVQVMKNKFRTNPQTPAENKE